MKEAIRRVYKHTPFSYGTIIPPECAKGAGLEKGADVRLLWGNRSILVILPIGMQLIPEERRRLEEILDGEKRRGHEA